MMEKLNQMKNLYALKKQADEMKKKAVDSIPVF